MGPAHTKLRRWPETLTLRPSILTRSLWVPAALAPTKSMTALLRLFPQTPCRQLTALGRALPRNPNSTLWLIVKQWLKPAVP